ncbi:MAG: hypothetical protein ACFFCH_06070 [Promethearchaeota archaeon]
MNRTREQWVYCCLCVVVVIGIVFWFENPIIAILAVIISLLAVGIIYVYRTSEYEAVPEPPSQDISSTDIEIESQATQISEEEPGLEPIEYKESLTLEVDLTPASPKPSPVQEPGGSTSGLRQRIAELEQRVKSLNEQLARDPRSSDEVDTVGQEEENGEVEDDEGFSEKAIQHLLESLDEKLAKRAISKQLYSRLRDKYIARLEKTKKRHGSAKRGTKTPA